MMHVTVQLNWNRAKSTIHHHIQVNGWNQLTGPFVLVPPYWKFEHERYGQESWVARYMRGTRERLIAEGVDEVICTWSDAVTHPKAFDIDRYEEEEDGET